MPGPTQQAAWGQVFDCSALRALTLAAEHVLPCCGLLPGLGLAGGRCWVPSQLSHIWVQPAAVHAWLRARQRHTGMAGGPHLGDAAGSHP